jgi:hypothetical protein
MQRFGAAGFLASLAILAACGGEGPSDEIPPFPIDQPLPSPAPVDSVACSLYPCFEACGSSIAVAPVERPFGFSEVVSEPWRWARATPVGAARALSIDDHGVEVRSTTDLGLLGRAPLPGGIDSAAVGDVALVQWPGGGALGGVEVGAAGAPSLTSWWFVVDAGSPYLRLLGSTGGRFAISTLGGVSFVELSDTGPREALCVPRLGLGDGDIRLIGDVLAMADGDAESRPGLAHLYRIDASGSREFAALPIEAALPFGGDGDWLTLTSDNRRRITSYDVSGVEPVEVGIAENLPTGSDDAPLGAFEFRGAGGQRVALDLQGGLERYDVTPIPGAECLWRLSSRATAEAFIVSPLMPGARLPAEPVPVVLCPARREYYDPTYGALGPDQRSVLFRDQVADTWVIRDLISGEERSDATLPNGSPAWVGERWVFTESEGTDFGLTRRTRVSVMSADASARLIAGLQSPGPVLVTRATARDVWALSYAREFDYGHEQPDERVLWRLDPGAGPPDIRVLSGVRVGAEDRLEAHGDTAYVLRPAEVSVIDRDGNTLADVPLPASVASSAASESGLFILGGGERLWRLAPGEAVFSLVAEQCAGCTLVGAAGARIYAVQHAPRYAWHPRERGLDYAIAYADLVAYVLSEGAATVAGRHPLAVALGGSGSSLLVGDTRVLALGSSLLALEPP